MAESNGVLIFSSELGILFHQRTFILKRQKFQLKIYNTVVSTLKIPTNDYLLKVYCHSNWQAKEDRHLRKVQH